MPFKKQVWTVGKYHIAFFSSTDISNFLSALIVEWETVTFFCLNTLTLCLFPEISDKLAG